MDDTELLRSYANDRSEAAFTELVRRHLNLVYSCALRQVDGDAHRAEEIAQAVFIDLARKAGSVARHPALAGWLCTSTHYAASRLKRAERRRHHHERESLSMSPETSEPSWHQVAPLLDDALHKLSPAERNAIVLRYMEQKSTTEVGTMLGLTESGARKCIERGLERLRTQLARQGVTSAPAALALALGSQTVLAAPPGLAASITTSALAGAEAGVPLLLTFMSATKLKVGLAALVIASLAGLWFSQQSQLRRVRTELADARVRLGEVQSRVADANRRAVTVRRGLDELAGIQLAGVGPLGSLPVTPGMNAGTARLSLDNEFAGLFRSLALDPATLDRFRDLLAERTARLWNAMRYVVEVQGQWLDEWLNKTEELEYIAVATRDIDARVRDLLGGEKFARYEAYVSSLPWRAPFKDLAALLISFDPLREEQIDQLTAWAAASGPDLFVNVVKSGPKIPDEVLTRARSILSPVQFEKLVQVKAATDGYKQMQTWNKVVKDSEETTTGPAPR